jgi:cob(I)alamin adenosyltransferase
MLGRLVERLIDRQVRRYAQADHDTVKADGARDDATTYVRKADYQLDKRQIAERLLRLESRIDAISAEVVMTERTLDVP